MMDFIRIKGRPLGPGHPCFIIAEAGANADNDPAKARDLVAAAHLAGADAIKFQTYTASKLSTKTAPLYWNGHEASQFECFEKLDKLPLDTLAQLVQDSPIPVFSTPFDLDAVDELDRMGVACFKVASADITYHELVRRIAQKGKPILISTGASEVGEVADAVRVCMQEGNGQIALMQCTLRYPCPPEAVHLRVMANLREKFRVPVGLSDHSIGLAVPFAAIALGADCLEKHFTLRKTDEGSPDHHMSVDPEDLSALVTGAREVAVALGCSRKEPILAEAEALLYARRSVTTTETVEAGETLTMDKLTCKRPGTGVSPTSMSYVVGHQAKVRIPADTTVTWEMVG